MIKLGEMQLKLIDCLVAVVAFICLQVWDLRTENAQQKEQLKTISEQQVRFIEVGEGLTEALQENTLMLRLLQTEIKRIKRDVKELQE